VRGAALRALASPARLEIVSALQLGQPATVDEIAGRLGRDPRALYHHLRPLLATGLVVEAGERPSATRPARLFALPATRFELDHGDRSQRARAARSRIAEVLLRRALRLHAAALQREDIALTGPRRELVLGHRVARLTPRGLERVGAKLRELLEALGEEHDDGGVPFALTVHLAPASAPE